jgi:hypothetical protein
MFKLKKNKMNILWIIILFLLFCFSVSIYCYLSEKNDAFYDNVEGFNIRQYYNSKKRNFNRLKNQYFNDSKIKIKKFLRKNNII